MVLQVSQRLSMPKEERDGYRSKYVFSQGCLETYLNIKPSTGSTS